MRYWGLMLLVVLLLPACGSMSDDEYLALACSVPAPPEEGNLQLPE